MAYLFSRAAACVRSDLATLSRGLRWLVLQQLFAFTPYCQACNASNAGEDSACSTIRRFSSVVLCRRRRDPPSASSTVSIQASLQSGLVPVRVEIESSIALWKDGLNTTLTSSVK
jgi:hypothetical protein